MIAALLVFATLRFEDAYNSITSDYKPIAVEAKDDYINTDLIYEVPSHYLAITMRSAHFGRSYKDRFGERCTNNYTICVNSFFEDFFNSGNRGLEQSTNVSGSSINGSCARIIDDLVIASLNNITFWIEVSYVTKVSAVISLILKLDFDD